MGVQLGRAAFQMTSAFVAIDLGGINGGCLNGELWSDKQVQLHPELQGLLALPDVIRKDRAGYVRNTPRSLGSPGFVLLRARVTSSTLNCAIPAG